MRRAPKPWGERLWDRVERFLEEVEAALENDEPQTATEAELAAEAREIRRAMVAENARRAR